MNWFYNLRIRTKLLSGFILVAVIAGIIGFIGIKQIHKLEDRDKILYEKITVPLSHLANIASAFQRVRVDTRDIILAQSPEEIEIYAKGINDLRSEVDKECTAFEKLINSQSIKDLYDHFLATRKEYGAHLDKLIELARANKDQEAFAYLNREVKVSADAERDAINQLNKIMVEDAKATSDSNTVIADKASTEMIIVLFIGAVSSIAFGIFISRSITKPINILKQELDNLADKGGDLTQEINIKSKDEIGILAQSFNKFIANLRSIMIEINKNANSLSSTAQQLTSSTEQTAAGANETSATMTEIARTVDDIANNVQDIGKVTESNAITAQDGNKEMIAFNKEMSEIDKATNLVAKVIEDLNQKAININQIVETITGIADQTNLLALNAAIEAARAGDAGKGFAVVAEEVRKLAEECSKSAKNIKELIKSMQDKATEAVRHVANSSNMVNLGISKSVELGNVFRGIVHSVESIGTQFESLIAATEEMTAGVQNIAASTQEQSAATEEVSAAAEALSNLALDLNELVRKFRV